MLMPPAPRLEHHCSRPNGVMAPGAVDLLAPGRCILLDFDGPVCNLFRGQLTGAAAAASLTAILIDGARCAPSQIPAIEDSLQRK
jgi:hypothetical protein